MQNPFEISELADGGSGSNVAQGPCQLVKASAFCINLLVQSVECGIPVKLPNLEGRVLISMNKCYSKSCKNQR